MNVNGKSQVDRSSVKSRDICKDIIKVVVKGRVCEV